MGQKVNPVGFRARHHGRLEEPLVRVEAGVSETCCWKTVKIRKFVKDEVPVRWHSQDRRSSALRDEVKVIVYTARPGVIIGRKGQEVEQLQDELQNLVGRRINIKIEEVTRPEIQAQLVAEDIAEQLSQAGQLPPHDEAGDGTHDGSRRKGNQDSIGRPPRRLGNGPPRKVDRRVDAVVDAAGQDRLRIHRSQDGPGHIGVQVWVNQGMYHEDETDGADAQEGQAPKKPKRAYKR